MPLIPCPFCHIKGDKLIELRDACDEGYIAHIHCEGCGANGPSVYREESVLDALNHAQELWNRRA